MWVVPFFKLEPSIQYPFLGTKMDRRSIFFLQIQLVGLPIYWVPSTHLLGTKYPFTGYERGGWSIFFLRFSQYPFFGYQRVVPYYFFKISVGTGYQKGWSPLIFSKFQLVPGTKMGGWSIFFFKFSQYPILAMGWYPTF